VRLPYRFANHFERHIRLDLPAHRFRV
jgi:hypothetical protein